jgi:outer membrane protein assembly factor BamB
MRRTQRAVRCLAAGIMAVGLAGCWPAVGQGPDRQAYNGLENAITPATVDQLATKWTAHASSDVQDPIVSDVAVHFTDDTNLYAVNRTTGVPLWTKPAAGAGNPVQTMGPAAADGRRLLVGHGYPNLGGHWTTEWVDAATGQTQSTAGSGLVDGLRGSTALLSGYAFGSLTPVILQVTVDDLATPGPGWTGDIDVTSGAGGQGAPPLTLGTARVYQAGVGLNSPPPGGTPPRANGVRAYPVATAPSPCPAPGQAVLCPSWSTSINGTTAVSPVLASDEGTIYTGTDAGTVYALDAATGAVQWTAAVGAGVTQTPALANGNLYVPTADGDLVVLAAAGCGSSTCSPLWQGATGARIGTQPAVAGGVVFTGSDDGTLTAFDAAGCGSTTCPGIWDEDMGNRITGGPIVTAGRLYVGTADDFLYALGLP